VLGMDAVFISRKLMRRDQTCNLGYIKYKYMIISSEFKTSKLVTVKTEKDRLSKNNTLCLPILLKL